MRLVVLRGITCLGHSAMVTKADQLCCFFSDFFTLIATVISVYIECISSLFFQRVEESVKGKVVVVTGAGHGLGKELVTLFAERGARVALIDINKVNNEKTAQEINLKKYEGKAVPYTCDISKDDELKRTFSLIKNALGPIDILINNAGIVQCKPIMELSSEGIKKTFDVNVFPQFTAIRCVLPDMIERKSGHIVSVASIAGLIGTSYLADYCASKFALVGMMKALDIELHANRANPNIHLTTICPVAMATGMFKAPKTRFESIFPIYDAASAAEQTVHSILTKEPFVCVPKRVEYAYRLLCLLPSKVVVALQEFFQYGCEPHKND